MLVEFLTMSFVLEIRDLVYLTQTTLSTSHYMFPKKNLISLVICRIFVVRIRGYCNIDTVFYRLNDNEHSRIAKCSIVIKH